MNTGKTVAAVEQKMDMEKVDRTELEAIDGGFLPIIYGLACAAGALAGYIGTTRALEGTGTLQGHLHR
jgi:lactobin A/cerein 7B family class IIb bacteriocin